MKNTYFFIYFLSIYFSLNAYSSNLDVEECNSLDINYDEPKYAETEEERIIRMDQQLEALLNSFEECVVKAVNRGHDADTTGAVAGMIAGRHYGFSKIPEYFTKNLMMYDELHKIATQLSNVKISN